MSVTTWKLPEPGDVVTRADGRTLYSVESVGERLTHPEAVRQGRGGEEWRTVHMVSLRSGRRFSERLRWLRWVDEDGKPGDYIIPASVEYAPSADREGEAATPWMMCKHCGAAVRTDRPSLVWYWCAGCERTSEHMAVGLADDVGERDNESRNVLLRQLRATEVMLEALGVRLRRRRNRKACETFVERGRGATTWFITLADDLSVEDQVYYLGCAWSQLAAANDDRWVTDEWRIDGDDEQMEWKGYTWERRTGRPS